MPNVGREVAALRVGGRQLQDGQHKGARLTDGRDVGHALEQELREAAPAIPSLAVGH